jgi:MMP 1-O-methyltransferase
VDSAADVDPEGAATEAGVSVADIEACFRLFLVSPPPADRHGAWLGRPVLELVRSLLKTEAFKTGVLTAVLLREPLPLQSAPPEPPWELLDWAQERLPLRPNTRRALGLASSWEQALELLIADPEMNSLSRELIAAGIDVIMAERVKDELALQVTWSPVGAVDSATAQHVRGWALDLCDKPTRLKLEIMADDVLLGTAMCNEPRADVVEHVGGDGNCGFTFVIPSEHRPLFASPRSVQAIYRTSGQQIGASILVKADSAPDGNAPGPARRRAGARGLRKYLRLSESVPGWTRGEEARALAQASHALPDSAVIVEIGAFFGSGTILLAGARKLRGSGMVHAVDPFDATGDAFSVPHYANILADHPDRTLREHFDATIRMAGLEQWVEAHEGQAESVARHWSTPIDLLFLDGDQSPAGARAAYDAWARWLKPGGVIALHNSGPEPRDPSHDGHVQLAQMLAAAPAFSNVRLVASTTFAHRHG